MSSQRSHRLNRYVLDVMREGDPDFTFDFLSAFFVAYIASMTRITVSWDREFTTEDLRRILGTSDEDLLQFVSEHLPPNPMKAVNALHRKVTLNELAYFIATLDPGETEDPPFFDSQAVLNELVFRLMDIQMLDKILEIGCGLGTFITQRSMIEALYYRDGVDELTLSAKSCDIRSEAIAITEIRMMQQGYLRRDWLPDSSWSLEQVKNLKDLFPEPEREDGFPARLYDRVFCFPTKGVDDLTPVDGELEYPFNRHSEITSSPMPAQWCLNLVAHDLLELNVLSEYDTPDLAIAINSARMMSDPESRHIREYFVKNGFIKAVIELPEDIVPGASEPLVALLITPAEHPVRFIDATAFSGAADSKDEHGEYLLVKEILDALEHDGPHAKYVDIEDIAANGYDLTPHACMDLPSSKYYFLVEIPEEDSPQGPYTRTSSPDDRYGADGRSGNQEILELMRSTLPDFTFDFYSAFCTVYLACIVDGIARNYSYTAYELMLPAVSYMSRADKMRINLIDHPFEDFLREHLPEDLSEVVDNLLQSFHWLALVDFVLTLDPNEIDNPHAGGTQDALNELAYGLLDIPPERSDLIEIGSGYGTFLARMAPKLGPIEVANYERTADGVTITEMRNVLWKRFYPWVTVRVEQEEMHADDFPSAERVYCFPTEGLDDLTPLRGEMKTLVPRGWQIPPAASMPAQWYFNLSTYNSLRHKRDDGYHDVSRGVTVNTGAMMSDPDSRDIRKFFVERGMIRAIIELPMGMVYGVSEPTVALLISSTEGPIRMIDGSTFTDDVIGRIRDRQISAARAILRSMENDGPHSRDVDPEEIAAHDFNLMPHIYME